MSEYIFQPENDSSSLTSGIEDMCALMPKDWYGTIHGEIVRCRDCEHMHTVRHWLGMDVDECWLHADSESGALGKERTEPNGFCAWGERKEA